MLSFAQKRITVAQSGKADYKTIQAALDAIPNNNKKSITIFVKKGIYKELITVDARKSFITLLGEDSKAVTIVII